MMVIYSKCVENISDDTAGRRIELGFVEPRTSRDSSFNLRMVQKPFELRANAQFEIILNGWNLDLNLFRLV